MKDLLLILVFIYSNQNIAQTFNGNIISENEIVEYASIFNKVNKQYTVSDEKGVFNINASYGDTLEINHLSYFTKYYIVKENSSTINLSPKLVSLREVYIKKNLNKSSKIKKVRKNKTSTFATSVDFKMAFKIKNDKKFELHSLNIPVKFVKNYSNKGVILFKLFKSDEDGNITDIGLSEEKKVEIDTISKKHILLNFKLDDIIIPKGDFFIVTQRVIAGEILYPNKKSISVNPFLYIKNYNNKERLYYYQTFFDNEWIVGNNFPNNYNPEIILDIEGVIVE